MANVGKVRRRVYQILEVSAEGDRASRAFDIFILTLILLNVIALALETVEEVERAAATFFDWFEGISVAIFAAEYGLRLWSCTADARYEGLIWGRIRQALRPLVIIDLLAIAPAFMPFLGIDLRSARIVRLFRVFRIVKATRHSSAMVVLARVVRQKREQLLATLFVLFVLLVLASSLIYFAERDAQPDYFSSIPAAVWWGISTLTGAGFEDVFPVTAAGRLIASMVGLLGIGMFALPTGILGAGFVDEMEKRRRTERRRGALGRRRTGPARVRARRTRRARKPAHGGIFPPRNVARRRPARRTQSTLDGE